MEKPKSSRRRPHEWTEEERSIIRQGYTQTGASIRELAERLGLGETSVRNQANLMGLGKKSDRKPWTPEEEEQLLDLVEKKNVQQIAKIMGRTVNSVLGKIKKLNASRTERNGWYTLSETCGILGVYEGWLKKRIENGAIRGVRHYPNSPGLHTRGGSGKTWHIEEKELREFIRRYPDELNGRNVDVVLLVHVLAGLLPPRSGNLGGETRKTLAKINARTGDGQKAFGWEPETDNSPATIVMFSAEREHPGVWKPIGRISTDELAEMMEDHCRREDGEEKNDAKMAARKPSP